jgi:hypothetical protein
MNRKTVLAGAVLLTGVFLASQANAYTYTTCDGDKVVWSNSFEMVQNTFSIPFGGQREVAVDQAIARWRNVRGMLDMVSMSSGINPFSFVVTPDGQNDVAVALRANIGGNNGLTLMVADTCWVGGGMEWVEADVFAASDLGFGPLEQTVLAKTSGRSTFLHEFGHAHGLDHAQFFNNMRVPQPRPLVGGLGETLDVLPDDAQGGRFLYPSWKSEINLFASAHRRNTSTDKILVNTGGTVFSCTGGGGTITINATAGNNGTIDLPQTERWWLSTSDQAFNGGIQIGQLDNTVYAANKTKTKQVTWTIPALPVGTYFLYHGVDVLDQIDESREDDNVAREALTIKVIKC